MSTIPDCSPVLQWLEPSIDTDGLPAWSPDGTKVAFYRFYEVDDLYDRSNITEVNSSLVSVNSISILFMLSLLPPERQLKYLMIRKSVFQLLMALEFDH